MVLVNPRTVDQYRILRARKTYGTTGAGKWGEVQDCVDQLRAKTALDYGCGRSGLADLLDVPCARYDPAIPEYAELPTEKVDLVVCTDVLDHIPSDDIGDVLAHIRSLSPFAFFHISTRLAVQILPNGENAHCSVYPAAEWLKCIRWHYHEARIVAEGDASVTVVTWET